MEHPSSSGSREWGLNSLRDVQEQLLPILDYWQGASTAPPSAAAPPPLPDEDDAASDSSDSSAGDDATTALDDRATLTSQFVSSSNPPAPAADDPTKLLYRTREGDPGLSSAIAGTSNTFTIEAYDPCDGERRRAPPSVNAGGSHGFSVQLSGTAVMRAKVYYEDDGTFLCEYRAMQTGKYRIAVLRHGTPLRGSPYTLTVKAPAGGLKDWKQKRAAEVTSLRAKRSAVKAAAASLPRPPRDPSPRINVAEQLEKAYELAFAIARRDREGEGGDGDSRERPASGEAAAVTDEHVLAV